MNLINKLDWDKISRLPYKRKHKDKGGKFNRNLKRDRSYHNSKFSQITFSVFSLASVVFFAIWWFNPQHVPHNFSGDTKILDIVLFILVSYVIWHPIIMEVLTWSISSHIKSLRQQKPVSGLKVAFITTIVPANESVNLLHKCLPAMVKAKYKHDTWLLDEGDNSEIKEICKQYGVKHFSRLGKSEYNTPNGKFTKTKGGNHNSWYDVYGNSYDIVAQIDTDFVPKPTFLTKTLGYFRDPKVAFVGTPQIYGNVKTSLVARGASEQQHSFNGSVLRGLSGMYTTLLIGANHVIRVAALKNVDHYSAHITEDLLTGMKLHTDGWKSIYVSTPLAIGEAPFTWEAYFNQQMRWAYGCMDILFHHSPKLFFKMGFRRTIYYFFLQQHYFSGTAMALSIFLLSLYFLEGIRAASVAIATFLIFYSLILLICWLMSVWLQRFNVHKGESELLIAGKIISIAAWPIWFLAFINVLTHKRLTYKTTPKGVNDIREKMSTRVFIPHIVFGLIALIGLLSSFITHRQSTVMIFWAFSSVVLMLSIPFIQTIDHGFSQLCNSLSYFIQSIYDKRKVIELKNSSGFLSKTPSSETPTHIDQNIIIDCLFLSFIVIMSLVLYIRSIGFYSDDWAFLGNFSVSHDQSLIGLFKTANTSTTLMRPIQNFYDSLLYLFFGIQPLGYQLVNAVVLVVTILLFYLVLRQLKLPRIIAVAAPLVYALLPNYATDRFWYAVFQANLSMLLYFFSLYAGLKAISFHTARKSLWKILSLFSLLLSALSYEVALPLFLFNMILFWDPSKKFTRKKSFQQKHTIFILLTLITLLYIFIFKAMTTTRLGIPHYPEYLMNSFVSVFRVNYGTLGFYLPHIWGNILSQYSNTTILVSGVILYLVIFWYLYSISSKEKSDFPSRYWMRNLTLISFVIFLFGYAIFITNNQVGFSPTGIENRVAIAAAIGVAFSIVGGLGWLSSRILPEKLSRPFFCILIAVICTGNFLIINTLALFWITAYQEGQVVLGEIHHQFPTIPHGSTLIVDGICPYVGPAIVFESQWDLKGALQTLYHDASLRADVVTPRLQIAKDGIHTKIYTFPAHYSYKNLFIYNVKNKSTYSIPNVQSARYYFQTFNPDYNNNCPVARAGNGVSIF